MMIRASFRTFRQDGRRTLSAGAFAAVAGLAAIALPDPSLAADAALEHAADSPWPKATRASEAPAVSVPTHFKSGEGNREAGGEGARVITSGVPGNGSQAWWTVFHDPALTALENDAMMANQDLQQALARVTEARMQARSAAADFFPHLRAPLNAIRQRTTDTGPLVSARIEGTGASALFGGIAGTGGTIPSFLEPADFDHLQ